MIILVVNPDEHNMVQEGRRIIYEGICARVVLTMNPDGYQMAGEDGRHC